LFALFEADTIAIRERFAAMPSAAANERSDCVLIVVAITVVLVMSALGLINMTADRPSAFAFCFSSIDYRKGSGHVPILEPHSRPPNHPPP
jgi:hypothetical protein